MTSGSRTVQIGAAVLVLGGGAVVLSRYGLLHAFDLALLLLNPLLWLLVLGLACWGGGQALWSRLRPAGPHTLTDVTISLAAGAGLLMAAAGLLALIHLLRPLCLISVLALLACRGAIVLWRSRGGSLSVESGWLWLILAAAGGISLVAASALSPFYDQWHYHLGFPYQWLRAGTVEVFPRHSFSFYWANMGLFYTYALAGPGAWAAQVSNWLMAAVATLGTAALARRLSPAPRVGVLAAVIFATTPALFEPATVATADIGMTVFSVAAWLCLIEVGEGRLGLRRGSAICGAFAGLAAGCKYLGLANVVVPAGVVVLVLAGRDRGGAGKLRSMVGAGLAFGVAATLVFGPWAARNLIEVGQPFYPFLSGLATEPSPGAEVIAGELTERSKDFGFGIDRIINAITLGTFAPQEFAGNIGPVYLWLLPLWLLWHFAVARPRGPSAVALGGFALGLLMSAGAWHLGRYLMPVLPLAAAGIAAAWTELGRRMPRPLWSLLSVVLAVVLLGNLNPNRTTYVLPQIRVALGRLPAEVLLTDNVTCWQAYRWINSELPADARVLMVAESRAFGIDRDLILEDPFQEPLLVQLAGAETSAAAIARRLESLGVTHVLVNRKEAERMTKRSSRRAYLECATDEAQVRLAQLFRQHLQPIWQDQSVQVYGLAR